MSYEYLSRLRFPLYLHPRGEVYVPPKVGPRVTPEHLIVPQPVEEPHEDPPQEAPDQSTLQVQRATAYQDDTGNKSEQNGGYLRRG